MHKTLAFLVCVAALSACSSQKSAKIVMHDTATQPANILPDNGDAPFKPVFGDVRQSQAAPVKEMTVRELSPRSDAADTIEIRKDDTLFTLARREGIPAKDIAEANNLKAPYSLSGLKTLKRPGSAEQVAAAPAKPVIAKTVNGVPVPHFRPDAMPVAAVIQENDGFKPFEVRSVENHKGHFIWPVSGQVISRFGPKSGGLYNDGVNIAAPEGTPIHASMDGTVVYAGNELANYGNLLILRHKNGWLTAYAHTKEIAVKKGDKVKMGQVVALVGQTGNVQTPQVHFAIRDGKKPLDPVLKVKG